MQPYHKITELTNKLKDNIMYPKGYKCEDIFMGVSYKKLFDLLEEKGLKKYYLRKNGINPKVIDYLSKNKGVNVSSIIAICKLLDCQPGDLMEYIPDEE